MLQCSIRGCTAVASERLSDPAEVSRWVILRPCLCGSGQQGPDKWKACICRSDNPQETFWPNLDWWAFGGVDKIILCPDHKILVRNEIVRQQGLDPSMDQKEKPNPTNRH